MSENDDRESHSFGYDSEGNTSGPHPEWPLDRIASLSFDARGNLLDDGQFVYAWDENNRLIDCTPYNLAKSFDDRVLFDDLSRDPFAFGAIIDDVFAGMYFGPTYLMDPSVGRWLICDSAEEREDQSLP